MAAERRVRQVTCSKCGGSCRSLFTGGPCPECKGAGMYAYDMDTYERVPVTPVTTKPNTYVRHPERNSDF